MVFRCTRYIFLLLPVVRHSSPLFATHQWFFKVFLHTLHDLVTIFFLASSHFRNLFTYYSLSLHNALFLYIFILFFYARINFYSENFLLFAIHLQSIDECGAAICKNKQTYKLITKECNIFFLFYDFNFSLALNNYSTMGAF
jgi:hypothetical protein